MIPESLQGLLLEYQNQVISELGDKVCGIYLYGSITLGAYEENNSDIDFITVLTENLSEQDLLLLQKVHENLQLQYEIAKKMDGIYIRIQDLGKSNLELSPYPFYYDGRLSIGHWNVNNVTWWGLKHNGITLYGKSANELLIPISWEDVEETMRYNIHTYWKKRLDRVETLVTDEDVADAVLTLARIYFTVRELTIIPKTLAGEKLIKNPEFAEWYPVIQESLRIRSQLQTSAYFDSYEKRTAQVVSFISHMIEECELYVME